MTNKKFKKAAMALALTACVAAAPLTANAESPENTADAQVPAAVDHADTDTAANAPETPEKKLPPPPLLFLTKNRKPLPRIRRLRLQRMP